MRKRLFNLAREGLEEGLDTSATIEEDGKDKPPETPGGEDDAALEDKPIEFPEIGNLEIDKVHDELMDEADERNQRVGDALSASSSLNTAVEALRSAYQREGRVSPAFAATVSQGLHDLRQNLGFNDSKPVFSLEEYGRDNAADVRAALESIGTTLRDIWRAVVRAMETAMAWLKKAFIAFFIGVEHDLKRTKEVSEAIIKQRKNGKLQELRANGVNDDEHYVSLPARKTLLTYKGKLPGDFVVPAYVDGQPTPNRRAYSWEESFAMLLELAKQHHAFNKEINPALVKRFESLMTKIKLGEPVDTEPPIPFNAFGFVMHGYYDCRNIGELQPLPNCAIVANDFFLGSVRFGARANTGNPLTLLDSLKAISDWGVTRERSSVEVADSWMPFLETPVLQKTSEKVVEICHELIAYRDTTEKMEAIQESFKKIAVAGAAWSEKMPSDFLDKNSSNGWRGEYMTQALRAINTIVANQNAGVFAYASFINEAVRAWNSYLKEIYLKENQLVKKSG